MTTIPWRSAILKAFGADASQIPELLAYNENHFLKTQLPEEISLPLAAEPQVEAWRQYLDDARRIGVFAALKQRLAVLNFPVSAGISASEDYRAATRRGVAVDQLAGATGLALQDPEALELQLYDTLAGPIPVIIIRNRADFETLVRAFACRNEPAPIPGSMGAAMIAGFNNWDRIRTLRRRWERAHPGDHSEAAWAAEFQKIIPQKQLYQDRFILLSDGPYSAVSPAAMNLSEPQWRAASLKIRLAHECAHYFTKRVYGVMRNNLLDELIADYMGIVAANGRYRADWFLQFLGLEAYPDYREGARLENYLKDPPLSPGAVAILRSLVVRAARHVEQFEKQYFPAAAPGSEVSQQMLTALTQTTLEELASEEYAALLEQYLQRFRHRISGRTPAMIAEDVR